MIFFLSARIKTTFKKITFSFSVRQMRLHVINVLIREGTELASRMFFRLYWRFRCL